MGRGTYGYISNLSHPTLYRISGIWSIDERDGERVPMLDVRIEDHDKLAQLVVGLYYEVLARVITYHGWPGVQHRELTQADRPTTTRDAQVARRVIGWTGAPITSMARLGPVKTAPRIAQGY